MQNAPGSRATTGDHETEQRATQWQGNVLLLIAIALLVGVATFVMLRERLAESSDAPAHSSVR